MDDERLLQNIHDDPDESEPDPNYEPAYEDGKGPRHYALVYASLRHMQLHDPQRFARILWHPCTVAGQLAHLFRRCP